MASLEITLNKPTKRTSESEESRGPLDRRRQPEYLPRRKIVKGIKFYDVAQNSDFSELAYRFGMILTPSPLGAFIATNGPTLTEYAAQADEIFSVTPSNWANTYMRITTEMLRTTMYRFRYSDGTTSLDSNNMSQSEWNGDGMSLPNSAAAAATIDFFFEQATGADGSLFETSVRVKGTGAIKFTATRNYAASAVAYEPRNGDEFYLFPVLIYPLAFFQADLPTYKRDAYWDDWRHWPRAVFNDPSSANYHLPPRAHWDFINGDDIGDGYAGTFRLLDMFRSIASNAQAYRTEEVPGPLFSHTPISPAAVPNVLWAPPAGPIGGVTIEADANLYPLGFTLTGGRLVLAVKRGSTFFYGWK